MVERKPSVRYALDKALKAVDPGPECAPAVALARRYAAQLDEDPDRLARLGRPFLAVLVQLRMTPHARAAVLDGDELEVPALVPAEETPGGAHDDDDSEPAAGPDAGAVALDELRGRRDRRKHGAAAVDTAPS